MQQELKLRHRLRTAEQAVQTECEPLLKWAGGKRRILSDILPLLPSTYGHYFEPFLGGGALFFSLSPLNATLSDSNVDLMNAYQQVRDNLDNVVRNLRKMQNSEAGYYAVRSSKPRTAAARAARLIYLCTLSFNGIYRQNLSGEFNVPYGYKCDVDPCNRAKLLAIRDRLRRTELLAGDFEEMIRTARRGDLVYFDPPYTVAHGDNGFVKYNAKIFSWSDQIRLATVVRRLRRCGVRVVVSNADHPSIRDLYSGFAVRVISRASVMAAAAKHRKPVTECVFVG